MPVDIKFQQTKIYYNYCYCHRKQTRFICKYYLHTLSQHHGLHAKSEEGTYIAF